jgi:hypothetical protein
MMADATDFTGKWLHDGDRQGTDFSHHQPEYDHTEAGGSTRMRFAKVDQDGRQTGVWAPAHWTDDQVREALTTNW